jgi:uncharacterized protein YprB with RNaseH-like and TPR domain
MRPEDKFARLQALRPPPAREYAPVGARGYSPELPENAERLARLLGAEIRRNQHGEYLLFRAWYPEPELGETRLDALELLAPGTAAAASDPSQWLFLDTETTGLAGGTGTYAFLIGIAWWEAGGIQVEQFFLREFSEEQAVLAALAERMQERRVLVTFNGKSFDWPLLDTRFRMTRTIDVPTLDAHLDLLHAARKLWRLRLGSVRLSELERHVLGRERGPDVHSQLIPQFYFDYLRGGPAEPLADVFHHNRYDLQGLAELTTKTLRMLASPAEEEAGPLELYSISRLLHSRGRPEEARQLYKSALTAGLPEEVDRAARGHLARLAKRDGDLGLAHSLWKEICGATIEGLEAYEQLAIYFEHKAKQPERALHLLQPAMDELQNAFRAGHASAAQYRRLKTRIEHRLARLKKRARLPLETA